MNESGQEGMLGAGEQGVPPIFQLTVACPDVLAVDCSCL